MKNCKGTEFWFRIVLLVTVWINESLADPPKLSDNMIKMKAVTDRILRGYDKLIRPTADGSNTTEVRTGFMPRQIITVDEERSLFVLDSFFFMIWKDPRLAWNSTTEYNDYIQLPPNLVWLPDLSVYNSYSAQINPAQDILLAIAPSGTVLWVPPIHTQTSCQDLMDAPYTNDVITCIVRLGAWAHDRWEIDYTHGDLYMIQFLNINPRWELITSDVKLIRNVSYYDGHDEQYVSLNAVFPIKRRSPPEVEATRKPCILVMLLTLSIFWLPPDSSKKVLLGGILFLALTILLVYVASSTKFPLAVLFTVSFLQSTMYILAVTLLLEVFVVFNVCNIRGPDRPPPAAMQFLTGPFGKYLCLRSSSNDNNPIDRLQLKEDTPNFIESPSPRDDWLLFAAGLDRILFLVMSIAMIAIHHL